MELRVSDWISPGVGKANCRRVRISVDGREWLSVLKSRVVSDLRANQCRLGMRIDVETTANIQWVASLPPGSDASPVTGLFGASTDKPPASGRIDEESKAPIPTPLAWKLGT